MIIDRSTNIGFSRNFLNYIDNKPHIIVNIDKNDDINEEASLDNTTDELDNTTLDIYFPIKDFKFYKDEFFKEVLEEFKTNKEYYQFYGDIEDMVLCLEIDWGMFYSTLTDKEGFTDFMTIGLCIPDLTKNNRMFGIVWLVGDANKKILNKVLPVVLTSLNLPQPSIFTKDQFLSISFIFAIASLTVIGAKYNNEFIINDCDWLRKALYFPRDDDFMRNIDAAISRLSDAFIMNKDTSIIKLETFEDPELPFEI